MRGRVGGGSAGAGGQGLRHAAVAGRGVTYILVVPISKADVGLLFDQQLARLEHRFLQPPRRGRVPVATAPTQRSGPAPLGQKPRGGTRGTGLTHVFLLELLGSATIDALALQFGLALHEEFLVLEPVWAAVQRRDGLARGRCSVPACALGECTSSIGLH